jgi:hypothetical protein
MRKSPLKSPLSNHFKFHCNGPPLVRAGGVSIAESGSLMEFLEAPDPTCSAALALGVAALLVAGSSFALVIGVSSKSAQC